MASRRIDEVWSPEYSPAALPSRWRAAPGEEGDVVDGAGHVEPGGEPDRLARLPGLCAGELVGAGVEDRSQSREHRGSLDRGGARPVRERLTGGGHRCIDVAGACQRHGLHRLARCRVDDVERRLGVTGERRPAAPGDELVHARPLLPSARPHRVVRGTWRSWQSKASRTSDSVVMQPNLHEI